MKKNTVSSKVTTLEKETRTVRERTLAHMENLLRNATKLGDGIALVCGVATQGCRYHVIDPPPPPPPGECENPSTLRLNTCVKSVAQWAKSGRKWTIDVNLRVEWGINNMDFEGLTSAEIHASGASVKTTNMGHQNVEIVLIPFKGMNQAELDLAVQCNKQQIPFRVNLDLSKPRKKKGYIPAELAR